MRNKKPDFTLLSDIVRMASGAIGPLSEVRHTLKKMVKERVDRVLYEMDFVSREEFEDLEAMVQASRLKQEALEKRLKAMEGKSKKKKTTVTKAKSSKAKNTTATKRKKST